MDSFVLMLQFFTRIPIRREIDIKENSFGQGTVYLPLVGVVVGLWNALFFLVAGYFLGRDFGILFALLGNLMITGALHLDGLADTCDGIFSSRPADRMLEIMKDSRIGTNGSIAIFFDLGFRFMTLHRMESHNLLPVILLMPVVSRTAVVLLMAASSKNGNHNGNGDGHGLGSLFLGKISRNRVAIALLIGEGLGYGIGRFYGMLSGFIACGFVLLLRKYILKKIEVITGDILGASIEMAEMITGMLFLVS